MTLRTEVLEGGALRLTMDRPKVANALNRALQDALVSSLEGAGRDASVRAVLLTGAGGRVFSAGADLREELAESPGEARVARRELLLRSLLAVLDCPRPLIAVVRGKAIGAGAMLALLSDEVLMEEGASLSLPEIALGMASPIGVAAVAARGGRAAAQALVQAGEPIGAASAKVAGLADAVHPDATLDEAAAERAARLGGFDPAAYAANKSWMNAPLRKALVRAAEHAAGVHMGGPVHAR
jgi:enoyl-CoA hydratase/carnithine racemase